MTGLRGEAAIVGYVERAPTRNPSRPQRFSIEQWAQLAAEALADAGIGARRVNGIVTNPIGESDRFASATLAEYLGIPINFGEVVDLGGATAAGMVWRAAAAVELGLCDVVLAMLPGSRDYPRSARRPAADRGWYGASSNIYGSPQAEFEIPYGNLGQNAPYAQIARRYAAEFGYNARATAKVAADQRSNANATPHAVFHATPLTIDDVLASPMVADPIHMLEMVMSCHGGAGVVIASGDVAARARHRPIWVKGFGERIAFKTPTYAEDLLRSPIAEAAEAAFGSAGLSRSDIDMASIYDCYTITVVMSLEDAGFCEKGGGMSFVASHDLTYRGDFPLNTSGGQLSFGQAGIAGGMHHVCDAVRQLTGRAGAAQVRDCNTAFVSGNGGIMSEQVALILQGA
ncbi:MAG: thiolase family protein [Propionibacteriales bacterium]|nr:thiolase family protein [Propionibacteriales bacterium]